MKTLKLVMAVAITVELVATAYIKVRKAINYAPKKKVVRKR